LTGRPVVSGVSGRFLNGRTNYRVDPLEVIPKNFINVSLGQNAKMLIGFPVALLNRLLKNRSI
jgi:hypothetical protein